VVGLSRRGKFRDTRDAITKDFAACVKCLTLVHGIVVEAEHFVFGVLGPEPESLAHGITTGKVRFFEAQTWATPLITNPLEPDDLAFNVLATSVIDSISEHLLSGGGLLAANTRSAVGPVAGRDPSHR
jgi:hypothetical protein